MRKSNIALWLITAVAMFCAMPAFARDLKLELLIDKAIADATWQGTIGGELRFLFGDKAPVNSVQLVSNAAYGNYARPHAIIQGRNVRRDEASTCYEALRNVLSDVAAIARTKGGNLIVVHSSDFLGAKPSNAQRFFLCNSGLNSSTVDVSVSVFREQTGNVLSPPAVQTVQTVPVQALPTSPRPLRTPSGYADVYDFNKLPTTRENCKKLYAEWLSKPNPKAFSLSSTGQCFYSWSYTPADTSLPLDPTERTLLSCKRIAKQTEDCRLYAVDDVVVWNP